MKTVDSISLDGRAAFFGAQDDLDTVVFVHGLGGHFRKTWKMFPELLASDPDLPKLDIFLWGYDSGVLKRESPASKRSAVN